MWNPFKKLTKRIEALEKMFRDLKEEVREDIINITTLDNIDIAKVRYADRIGKRVMELEEKAGFKLHAANKLLGQVKDLCSVSIEFFDKLNEAVPIKKKGR